MDLYIFIDTSLISFIKKEREFRGGNSRCFISIYDEYTYL